MCLFALSYGKKNSRLTCGQVEAGVVLVHEFKNNRQSQNNSFDLLLDRRYYYNDYFTLLRTIHSE